MNTIKGFLAVGSVAFCGLASGGLVIGAQGCAEPGVVQVNPTGKNVNKKDAGTPKKDAGKPVVEQDEDEATADEGEDEDEATDEPTDEPTDEGDEGSEDEDAKPASAKDAGKTGVDAGTAKPGTDAGKPTTGGGDAPVACPSGYMCMDPAGPLAEMGLEGSITDQDGEAVTASCSKGGQETCDPKDPKKSCPQFSNPFCVHVKLTGIIAIELDQCAQKCEL